jgi:hypothetical protein
VYCFSFPYFQLFPQERELNITALDMQEEHELMGRS